MSRIEGFTGWLRRHRLACFGLMAVAFVVFGLLTLDLVRLVSANAALIKENGWQALQDGGLQQLAELIGSSVAAMAAWIVFKVCEMLLVQSFTR
jgi:hypothetical protein